MILLSALLTLGLSFAGGTTVLAAEYPCPSDPGFCYRDLGDDQCFDVGTDTGPIDAEISSAATLPPGPPVPGSIVCPPSVKRLVATGARQDLRLETSPGSSILFFGATIESRILELSSGDRLLLGGRVRAKGDVDLVAAGDISIEAGIPARLAYGAIEVFVESVAGDISIGPKARFRASSATFLSSSGKIHSSQSVFNLRFAGRLRIAAAQEVLLTHPRVVARSLVGGSVVVAGQAVTINGKTKISATTTRGFAILRIVAHSGDVDVEQLDAAVEGTVDVSGTNVFIGGSDGARPSRIFQRNSPAGTGILASETIALDGLDAVVTQDVNLVSGGDSIAVTNSTFKGRNTVPTVFLGAGPGSTCDLTGTRLRSATLVANCDSVRGP